MKRIFNLSNLTLLVALALSGIAAWYSILGLVAIFASAVIPIIIMGGALEIAKVVTTVWLHKYWSRIGWNFKLYLVPAVISLAFLTSMGIFGFLSKAHMDQGVPTGDVLSQISLIDEKINVQRENIDMARKGLAQMDEQVNQRLSRGVTEQGAERAVTIRKQQTTERNFLQKEIAQSQIIIAKLNEERAPLASEMRKLEAEVGPIKYIAALIYGDDPDQNILERAVRWVIILIVLVFDPLALTLVIASTTSRRWEVVKPVEETVSEPIKEPIKEPVDESIEDPIVSDNNDFDISKHPYLFVKPKSNYPPGITPSGPWVAKSIEPEVPSIIEEPPENLINIGNVIEEPKKPVATITDEELESTTLIDTKSAPLLKEVEGGYVIYEGKLIAKDALREMKPEIFKLVADSTTATTITSSFGISFPKFANKGDIFVRVDSLPNRVFRFDGSRWFEVNRELSQTYLQDTDYIQFLISKIDSGEYDIELLSDSEREQIESYLNSIK